MSKQPTDAELIARSLEDPAWFGEIFERHYDRILGYLSRRAGRDVGQEVAAQTFEEALRHRHRFDARFDDASPWLFGIASHLLAHHARAQRTRFEAYAKAAAGIPPSVASPEESLEGIVNLPVVTQALLQLPAGDRDAMLLFAWADLSYEQIAHALEIPIGTVRSRINRVRRRLRELMEPDGARMDEEPEP